MGEKKEEIHQTIIYIEFVDFRFRNGEFANRFTGVLLFGRTGAKGMGEKKEEIRQTIIIEFIHWRPALRPNRSKAPRIRDKSR